MAPDSPVLRELSVTQIVVIAGRTPDAPVRWAAGEAGELSAAGTADGLADVVAELPDHDELTVILPGEAVSTRRLRLPVRGEARLLAAARLAFEDVLAEPAQGYDLAWTEPDEDGARRVSAAPPGWLAGWRAALADAGLDPDLLTVDHAALHAEGYDGVVLRERGRIAASLPGGGLTGEEGFVAPLIPRLAPDASLLSVRIGPSGEAIGSESLVLADERALGAFYLAGMEAEPPASFARGRRRRGAGLARLSAWRVPAALVAACLALWLAGDLAVGVKHARAADALEAEATETFRAAFPGRRVIDLRRQAEGMGEATGGARFLPLSAALASSLEAVGGVELTGMTYDGASLTADIRYRDFAQLEALTARLRASGLTAREGQNPRREDDAYVDRITLGGGA